jgi:hypothetical protein
MNRTPKCAAANPAIALRLQSTRPVGRVAELVGGTSRRPATQTTNQIKSMKTNTRLALAALRRVTELPLNAEPIDSWLSKWGSVAGGLVLVALTVAVLPSQTSSQAEIVLGIGVAVVACANLFLFGVLSRKVHLAWHRGAVPWRVRIGEFLGLGAGIGIIGAGVWCIQTLHLTPTGMLIGGLLALSMAIAIMCLGLYFTLSKAA